MALSWGMGWLTHLKIFNPELFLSKGNARTKKWNNDWRQSHPQTTPPWDPSQAQTPNPDPFPDAKICLQIGAWHGCPLRSSARTWLRQMQILTANHWTDHEDTNGRVRNCYPIGTISTKWTPQSSQGQKHQPKSIHESVMFPAIYIA